MVALNTNYDRGPGARPFIHDLTNRVSGAVAAVNHAADAAAADAAAAAAANDLLGAVVSLGHCCAIARELWTFSYFDAAAAAAAGALRLLTTLQDKLK